MHKVTLQHSSPQIRRPTGAMVLGLCAAIVSTACGGNSASATDSTNAIEAAVSTLSTVSTGCPTVRVSDIMRQGGGVPATCRAGSWVFNIPADSNPALVRRTEAIWTRPGTTSTRFTRGSTVVYDAYFVGGLGGAGQADGSWHVLWQLQGVTRSRGWVPPSVSLAVRNGQIRLEGGHGHPRHSWSGRSYWWHRTLGRYRDGVRYHVQVVVRVAANPASARITATLNGVRKFTRWMPRSPEGYSSGTIYADQAWLESRSGLYRGTQYGAPPTYQQFVTMRIARLG